MSGPNLPDGKDLDSLEFICLECSVPDGCDESDPRCAYRQARPKSKSASRWAWLFEKVAVLRPGAFITESLPTADALSARSSVMFQVRSGNIPQVKTWTIREGIKSTLTILRKSVDA